VVADQVLFTVAVLAEVLAQLTLAVEEAAVHHKVVLFLVELADQEL
jgi:hypothetical protein